MLPVVTDVSWSVCMSVGHNHEPCKIGWTSQDTVECGVTRSQGRGGGPDPRGEGAILRGAFLGPLWSMGSEPKLFSRWRQQCSPSLSVLKQLVTLTYWMEWQCHKDAVGAALGVVWEVCGRWYVDTISTDFVHAHGPFAVAELLACHVVVGGFSCRSS